MLPVLPAILAAGVTVGRRRPLGIVLGLALTFTITVVGFAELVGGVGLGDNYFVRPSGVPTVTVARGERVTWRWRGRRMHNVTVARGPVRFASSTRSMGTFSRRLTRRGTYSIFCTIHGPRDQSLRLVAR